MITKSNDAAKKSESPDDYFVAREIGRIQKVEPVRMKTVRVFQKYNFSL